MLGVFAEFETNLRRERQMEGIAAAKARGVYKGRRPAAPQSTGCLVPGGTLVFSSNGPAKDGDNEPLASISLL
jgi:DNA invertase Pin-like site-specific DNA recombinase